MYKLAGNPKTNAIMPVDNPKLKVRLKELSISYLNYLSFKSSI
jgi:hypothetical protein